MNGESVYTSEANIWKNAQKFKLANMRANIRSAYTANKANKINIRKENAKSPRRKQEIGSLTPARILRLW